MARASLLLSSCVVLFGVSAACGARTGLPSGALACTGVPVKQIRQVPNVYFILDRSSSMTEGTPSKWEVVRNDIADLMTKLGDEAEFGAAWFPPVGGDVCGAGAEVMKLRLGDGEPGSKAGSTANEFLSKTNVTPLGGTPTAETFLELTPELTHFTGHTFAILATDGGPNCNLGLTCGLDSCTVNIDGKYGCSPSGPSCCTPTPANEKAQQNCLDGARTVAAVAALATPSGSREGVPTFAIGVPGSEAYADILEQIAKAGKTPRASPPYYYQVNTANSSELVGALANIAARIAASCEIELKDGTDPDQTNVVVAGEIVPESGANGWSLSGKIVTLLGKTCDQVRTEGEKVVVTEGCATILK